MSRLLSDLICHNLAHPVPECKRVNLQEVQGQFPLTSFNYCPSTCLIQ